MSNEKLYTKSEIEDFELLAVQEFLVGNVASFVLTHGLDLENMLAMVREVYASLLSRGTVIVDKSLLAGLSIKKDS